MQGKWKHYTFLLVVPSFHISLTHGTYLRNAGPIYNAGRVRANNKVLLCVKLIDSAYNVYYTKGGQGYMLEQRSPATYRFGTHGSRTSLKVCVSKKAKTTIKS